MTDDTDIDGLAGEYVLGALGPDERSAVAARLAKEPRLAAAVADWERRLAPLGWRAPGVDTKSTSLSGILATIARGSGDATRTAEIVVLRRRARTWQLLATGLAATLAAVAVGIGGVGQDISSSGRSIEVAVLASMSGSTTADEAAGGISVAFSAAHDLHRGRLTIRQVAGRPAAGGRLFVAWLEPAAGATPKLLGPLSRDDATTHLDVATALFKDATSRLIVSLEQDRAAPMDRPRGPIVSAGRPIHP